MSADKDLSVVILAAGQGTRMKSSLAKGLHNIGGKPMLAHVIEQAKRLHPKQLIVIYGWGGEALKAAFSDDPSITWVEQKQQKGTADAVAAALPSIPNTHQILTLYGDVPLILSETLQKLIEGTQPKGIGILTATVKEPYGLGRILRDPSNRVLGIVEEKDATPQQRTIAETNTGIGLFPADQLAAWLSKISNNNAQGEYYLTDVFGMAAEQGCSIFTTEPADEMEVMGVNDRVQQAVVERCYQRRQAEQWMLQGVEIIDPNRFETRGTFFAEAGVSIDINCIFEGHNHLRKGTRIGANSILINCDIAEDVTVLPNSYLEDAKISKKAIIGPYARIRPGTVLGEEVHIGNFVEVKNSLVDTGTKINHLSYIGDATIGKHVNVGAGTITCNYDGANKHRTVIGDNVHIGSDSQLVAPVQIGDGATLAAGSTLVKDAPAGLLTVTHQLKQRSEPWERPQKDKDQK